MFSFWTIKLIVKSKVKFSVTESQSNIVLVNIIYSIHFLLEMSSLIWNNTYRSETFLVTFWLLIKYTKLVLECVLKSFVSNILSCFSYFQNFQCIDRILWYFFWCRVAFKGYTDLCTGQVLVKVKMSSSFLAKLFCDTSAHVVEMGLWTTLS